MIAGNKCDKDSDRQIKKEDAEEYAKRNNAKYFETSAKTNKGIQEVFNYLGAGQLIIYYKIIKSKLEILKRNQLKNKGGKEGKKNILVGEVSDGRKKKNEGCC